MSGRWKKLRWSIAHRGLFGTMWFALGRMGKAAPPILPHPFDATYGVETSGLIGGAELGSGSDNDIYATAYYGIAPSRLRGALERWASTPPLEPIEQYTFLDVGCGKGRAMMLASEWPFREVWGIEMSPQLASVAERNIAVWRSSGRALCPIQVVRGDVALMDFPEGPCLMYLYNPFGAPVMKQLVEQLVEIFYDRPGRLDILYQNPEQESVFQRFEEFQRLWSEVIPISAEDSAVDLVSTEKDRCSAYRR